jgi:UDP-N-acetylglucosamine--N-acetylmuramyl-(pentapeptide) pyrophosphoryl-undecaprenol N-acetylglucosamine transferase
MAKSKRPIMITGGHMTPALAVMSELQKRGHRGFTWAGHKYNQYPAVEPSPEYKTVTALKGVTFYDLPAGRLVRSWYKSLTQFRLAIINALKVPWGFIKAFNIVRRTKPAIVISFGGYLGLPAVLSAWLMGIPALAHEQTVTGALANKLSSWFVQKVMISWPQALDLYPENKRVLTGNPIRPELLKHPQPKPTFKVNNQLPTILVTGGNQGALLINTSIFAILGELLKFTNVVHQLGTSPRTQEAMQKLHYSLSLPGKYFHKDFFGAEEQGSLLHHADIIISRSGANTVTEVLAIGTPTIFIPIPWVTHNEQYLNAKMVETTGLGKIITQENLSPEVLLECIKVSLAQVQQKQALSKDISLGQAREQARRIVRLDAPVLIADIVESNMII